MTLIPNARTVEARRDPTRTAVLRDQYTSAVTKRFVQLRRLIRKTVVDNDALMLDDRRGTLRTLAAQPAQRYAFPSDPVGKADAFMAWLMDAVDQGILEVTQRDERKIASHSAWQNLYVKTAYTKGISRADQLLEKAGLFVPPDREIWQVFQQPIHANTLAMLYTRNFDDLRGITEAMGTQISRTLTMGLARGWGMAPIARALTKDVDGIGIRRATLLARTEIIHAFAESTLNRFEEAGVEEVAGEVEISTAGDHRVCEVCKGLVGKRYTIKEARGLIPVHPQCRCAWVPVL